MNLIFAGTPEFARVALDALVAAGHRIALVLTQPDRPAGRGLKPQPSAVKQAALQHGLPVLQPRSLRLDGRHPAEAAAAHAALRDAQADAMVVAAYGLILPQQVLDLMRQTGAGLGCLNIHASLLPRWRGAAPIHRAIEAGDPETGITLMQMDAGLDTGDILALAPMPIADDDTTARLHDRLAALGARCIVEALARPEALHARAQPTEGVTYAHKIDKAEALIDWHRSAACLARRVRAFDPFPGAATVLPAGPTGGPETLKIWSAVVCPGTAPDGAQPGEVLGHDTVHGVRVATGDGVLGLRVLQRPGGRRLDVAEFLRGCPLPVGRRLGAEAC